MIDCTLVRLANSAKYHKKLKSDERVLQFVRQRHPVPIVAHGPFQGMRYPGYRSAGSMLLPKLIGSYESELHTLIYELLKRNYSAVIDIGCAEGYYAVGFALKLPDALVIAYDTDPVARELCTQMALLNGVGPRVSVQGFCSPDTLKNFHFPGRSLVIADCEGYEQTLFNREVAHHLRACDVLIELHDFIDINISSQTCQAFQETHRASYFDSIDDIQKARTYSFEELDGLDLASRKLALEERRPTIMQWVFLEPRGM